MNSTMPFFMDMILKLLFGENTRVENSLAVPTLSLTFTPFQFHNSSPGSPTNIHSLSHTHFNMIFTFFPCFIVDNLFHLCLFVSLNAIFILCEQLLSFPIVVVSFPQKYSYETFIILLLLQSIHPSFNFTLYVDDVIRFQLIHT